MLGSSRVAAQLAASREGLGSMRYIYIYILELEVFSDFRNKMAFVRHGVPTAVTTKHDAY
jgi:hypothetical protein